MKIKLKSKELVKIRKQLKEEMEEYGKQQKKLVEVDKKHKKSAHKINRIKEKGQKVLHKVLLKQHKMDEFDYFTDYEAVDDETLECSIINAFDDVFGNPEAMKEKMREDRKKQEGLWADKTMFIGHKDGS